MSSNFNELTKRQVFNKCQPVAGLDPYYWGMEDSSRLISFSEYGNYKSPYGWQIDHHPLPQALGGSDELWNLRPLHHAVNASLGGVLGGLLKAPEVSRPTGLAALASSGGVPSARPAGLSALFGSPSVTNSASPATLGGLLSPYLRK